MYKLKDKEIIYANIEKKRASRYRLSTSMSTIYFTDHYQGGIIMAYNIIAKANKEKGHYSATKIVTYFRNKLGYDLVPVQGQYNKYWFRAVYKDGKEYEFVDGPKYYKLVVNLNDFGVEAGGDLNSWQFAGKIRSQLKEAS